MGADLAAAFDEAAPRYDLMVRLNPGYHRHLRAAARALLPLPPDRRGLVDLGCGSGASTRALLDVLAGPEGPGVTGVTAKDEITPLLRQHYADALKLYQR